MMWSYGRNGENEVSTSPHINLDTWYKIGF